MKLADGAFIAYSLVCAALGLQLLETGSTTEIALLTILWVLAGMIFYVARRNG